MKITLLLIACLAGYLLGIVTAPDNYCVQSYRAQVDLCLTDSECEQADYDLTECLLSR